jgi:hypothetical protein
MSLQNPGHSTRWKNVLGVVLTDGYVATAAPVIQRGENTGTQ